MKSTLITVYILFIDATTLIALIVSAILDSDVSAWILIGLFMAHSISYHVVSVYLFRLIHRIRVCRIPTPHGRLVDADRMIAVLRSAAGNDEAAVPLSAVQSMIENAPTIIEQEA